MINLLPTNVKEERRYARNNRKLAMWLVVSLCGILGLLGITGGGYLLLQQSIDNEEKSNRELAAVLEAQNIDSQIAEFQAFSKDLNLVTDILDERYLLSTLVQRIAGTIPPDSVLTGISLTGEERSLNMTFSATTNDKAVQVLVNLNDPENGLFSQADTENITCTGNDPSTEDPYPCSTSIVVLLDQSSDFVLLNGLLTEQAIADVATNILNQNDTDGNYFTEQSRISGLKNTFDISTLSDNRSANNDLRSNLNAQYTYRPAGSTEDTTTDYFTKISVTSHECPGNIVVSATSANPERTFACRTTYTITIANDPEGSTDQGSTLINSLQEELIKEFRTIAQ